MNQKKSIGKKAGGVALVCCLGLGSLSQNGLAEILTFDDIYISSTGDTELPDGYGGFNWSATAPSWDVTGDYNVMVINKDTLPGSGYDYGTVSPNNCTYNPYGTSPTTISWQGTDDFDFYGAYFTSAWYDQTLTFYGYLDGVLVYSSTTYNITTTSPLHIVLDWIDIDRLVIESSKMQWAMDNFEFFDAIPAPYFPLSGTGNSWSSMSWYKDPSWSSSPRYWRSGSDAYFIGSGTGNVYQLNLDRSVVVRDMGIIGGTLTIKGSSGAAGITFTNTRDNVSTLDVDLKSGLVFGVPVNATGGLTKSGQGSAIFSDSLIVDGDFDVRDGMVQVNSRADISGSTSVDGALFVDGDFTASSVNINKEGLLGGNGTIHGNVITNGTVSPGHSIGTLTIDGNFTLNSRGTYLAELGANGASDLLKVSGKATLNGGTLQLAGISRSLYEDGTSWTILHAGGGISGHFGAITGVPDSATLSFNPDYSSTEVDVVVDRIPYANFGQTANERAVGTNFDNLVSVLSGSGRAMESFLIEMDFDYSADQISEVLAEINPEIYTAAQNLQLTSINRLTDRINSRIRYLTDTRAFTIRPGNSPSSEMLSQAVAEESNGLYIPEVINSLWNFWGQTGADRMKVSDNEASGYEADSTDVVMGVDRIVFPWLNIGLAVGAGYSELDGDRAGSGGKQDSVQTALYFDAHRDGLSVNTILAYSKFDNNIHRMLDFISTSMDGDYDGDAFVAKIDGGYDLSFGSWIAGPTAALSYLYSKTDDFNENDSNLFNLKVEKTSCQGIITSLGARTANVLHLGKMTVLPELSAEWQHAELTDNDLSASFSYAEEGIFAVNGIDFPADSVVAKLSTNVQVNDAVSIYGNINGIVAKDWESLGASIGLLWSF